MNRKTGKIFGVIKSGFNKNLSKDQIASAMHNSFVNAEELFMESKLLRKNKRYARSLSLAILGLEELAKIPLLYNGIFLKKGDKKAWEIYWNHLLSHKVKQSVWASYGKFSETVKSPVSKFYKDRYPSGMQTVLEDFKEIGFYTSFFDGKSIMPNDVIQQNKQWLNFVHNLLRNRLEGFRKIHGTRKKSHGFVNAGVTFSTIIDRALMQNIGLDLSDTFKEATSNRLSNKKLKKAQFIYKSVFLALKKYKSQIGK